MVAHEPRTAYFRDKMLARARSRSKIRTPSIPSEQLSPFEEHPLPNAQGLMDRFRRAATKKSSEKITIDAIVVSPPALPMQPYQPNVVMRSGNSEGYSSPHRRRTGVEAQEANAYALEDAFPVPPSRPSNSPSPSTLERRFSGSEASAGAQRDQGREPCGSIVPIDSCLPNQGRKLSSAVLPVNIYPSMSTTPTREKSLPPTPSTPRVLDRAVPPTPPTTPVDLGHEGDVVLEKLLAEVRDLRNVLAQTVRDLRQQAEFLHRSPPLQSADVLSVVPQVCQTRGMPKADLF
ncbi:hypothetical protein LTR37_017282 [Vermiconidia calcicola]|uniref:Uncharacterized protein n=1 Tax=Vermiconidia calcicola TaxID=1690605 RepID=A0ACC3MKK5_9PEZI|nr:hypothetical protein LTR37_017282 [Vermiconidia calcicola]